MKTIKTVNTKKPRLTPTEERALKEKIILDALKSYDFPVFLEQLASDIGHSPDWVSKQLKSLEQQGLVKTIIATFSSAKQWIAVAAKDIQENKRQAKETMDSTPLTWDQHEVYQVLKDNQHPMTLPMIGRETDKSRVWVASKILALRNRGLVVEAGTGWRGAILWKLTTKPINPIEPALKMKREK